MRFFPMISAVVLLLGWAPPGAAQEPAELSLASTVAPRTRVRLVSTTVQEVKGVVIAADEPALTLVREGGPPLKVPMRSIVGMDMSLGSKRNWLKGLGIGALTEVRPEGGRFKRARRFNSDACRPRGCCTGRH
jgi:hypothetical protein